MLRGQVFKQVQDWVFTWMEQVRSLGLGQRKAQGPAQKQGQMQGQGLVLVLHLLQAQLKLVSRHDARAQTDRPFEWT